MSTNNRIAMFIVVWLILVAAGPVVQAQYSGGNGTPDEPYQIATVADLTALSETPEDHDKHFIQTADIDLSGITWGTAVIPSFSGKLDGQGHRIVRMTITGGGNLGLIGILSLGGMVTDLGLEDVNNTGSDDVGILVGHNSGMVSACYSTGTVTGDEDVGGLVGHNSGTVSACHSSAAVTGSYHVGGLVGYNPYGMISACYSTGTVTGVECVGGLVGENYDGTISVCYSTGTVMGDWCVGGLVGENDFHGTILACYSTGMVMGDDDVGGLVGDNNYATISACYSIGTVTGDGSYVGSLVGENPYGTISASFWDMESAGQSASDNGKGLTTSEMQMRQTFVEAGWDFPGERANGLCEYWQMPTGGGYPVLGVFNGRIPHAPDGMGTVEDPYLVETAEDLGTVWYRPAAWYRLAADIDLSGITWGMAVIPGFSGDLNGQGHRIGRMTIAGGGQLGLIGLISAGAVVADLGIEDVNTTGSDAVGGLAGANAGTISACCSTGTVTGDDYFVGGLVGENHVGTISACHSTGTVLGYGCVGGLVGYSVAGMISACYSTETVTGDGWVGGLVGDNSSGAISECYSTGTVTGDGSYVGGLVGNNAYGTILACYSTGTVTGDRDVGGLVGENDGTISVCYSTGLVTGSGYVGGLVGQNWDGVVSVCYSTGTVTGDSWVGGLVGNNYYGTISASFWDTEVSGLSTSDGGVGLTTGRMQTANTFLEAGWDFVDETDNGTEDTWWIDEGRDYPRLSGNLSGTVLFRAVRFGMAGVSRVPRADLAGRGVWCTSGCDLRGTVATDLLACPSRVRLRFDRDRGGRVRHLRRGHSRLPVGCALVGCAAGRRPIRVGLGTGWRYDRVRSFRAGEGWPRRSPRCLDPGDDGIRRLIRKPPGFPFAA